MKDNQKPLIELKGITKCFDEVDALKDVNLYILRNEFLTLLGPSGCGKSTMLRIIGGFESADSGELYFEGQEISNLPSYKRRVNTVFQKYALFPHLNVEDNIAFGLKIKKVPKKEIKERVQKMLELVNLEKFAKKEVNTLSGGQQQRIAIARALINEPEVLLLDEPLAALDLKLRKEMQIELKRIQKQVGITFVFVTHDQEEALTMSDTIVVMNDGVIQQIGEPEDIYNEPKNSFVANFIGESNIISGYMRDELKVEFAGRIFDCIDKGFEKDEPVDIMIRPEDIYVVQAGKGMLEGVVESVTFKGVHYEIIVKTDTFTWTVHSTAMNEVGEKVSLILRHDLMHIMHKQ